MMETINSWPAYIPPLVWIGISAIVSLISVYLIFGSIRDAFTVWCMFFVVAQFVGHAGGFHNLNGEYGWIMLVSVFVAVVMLLCSALLE